MSLWVRLVEERTKLFDCVKKGWVMDGFPATREQALALQSRGIYPRHFGMFDVLLGLIKRQCFSFKVVEKREIPQ